MSIFPASMSMTIELGLSQVEEPVSQAIHKLGTINRMSSLISMSSVPVTIYSVSWPYGNAVLSFLAKIFFSFNSSA